LLGPQSDAAGASATRPPWRTGSASDQRATRTSIVNDETKPLAAKIKGTASGRPTIFSKSDTTFNSTFTGAFTRTFTSTFTRTFTSTSGKQGLAL
jgi:hypothetical protein